MKIRLLLIALCVCGLVSESWACEKFADVLQDPNGKGIRNASIAVRANGSSTNATIYSNAACTTTTANPIITGTDGTYSFYATNGRYDLVVTKPGFTFPAVQTSDFILFDPANATGFLPPIGSEGQCLLVSTGAAVWGTCPGAGSGAPTTSTYITQVPDATLSAEQALSLLGSGVMKSTTGTGVVSIAAAGTDYASPSVSNTWADGTKQTFNPNGTNAGLNIGANSGDPTSLANGDIWYESSANKFRCRENGASVNCIGTTAQVTSVDATEGVETVSGVPITSTGTIRGHLLVNAQTGTTYTVVAGDRGKLVTFSNASPVAVTLPQAGGSFPSGWYVDFQNRGAGTATVTPTTSTIDGSASLNLNTGSGFRVASDGTNYFTQRGSGGGGGAPTDAPYWTGAAVAGLSAEHNLGALSTGIVKNTSGTPSTAVAGTDYAGVSVSNSWADDVKQLFNPGVNNAGVNVGSHTAAPTSPANGDVYYDSTLNRFRCRENANWVDCVGGALGATYITQTADGSLTNEQALSALATGCLNVTTGTGVIGSTGVVCGGGNHAVTVVNAGNSPYTTVAGDELLECDTGTGNRTVNLITAVGRKGKHYWVKNTGVNQCTIDGNAAETIDGGTTAVLTLQFEAIELIANNAETGWNIF